jgi:hypothetical protein
MVTSPERSFFDRLDALGSTLRGRADANAFRSAEPFPYVVIDGFFEDAILDPVIAEFPSARDIDWIQFDNPEERKLATRDERQIGFYARTLINWLNSSTFLEFVEDLTGFTGLIPDPHLDGGGLHQIPPGGKLGIHSDFLMQQRLKLERRLNLILYLNRDWREEWGGALELWDREMQSARKKIFPHYNRLVVFNTTATSFHGHPEPLGCPPDRSRRSIALYYYTNGRPVEEAAGVRPTLFQLRPGERRRWKIRQVLRRFVPPILNDIRYLKR